MSHTHERRFRMLAFRKRYRWRESQRADVFVSNMYFRLFLSDIHNPHTVPKP